MVSTSADDDFENVRLVVPESSSSRPSASRRALGTSGSSSSSLAENVNHGQMGDVNLGSASSLEAADADAAAAASQELARSESDFATYTVDDALNHLGFGRYQVFMLVYTGMAWTSDAMEMMLLSFIGPAVRCYWKLSPVKESIMSAVVFLGMMVGAYVWGYVSDKYGRRTGFLATAAATFLFGLASAFAPSFAWLVLFRCFVGFGLGGVPVAFTLFLEFVPSANRGKWLVTMESFWTVGSFFESALAWALLPTHGWRWLLAFSTLPLFMLLVCFPWLPESPHYLAANGRIEEAQALLFKVAAANRKPLPPGRLVANAVKAGIADDDKTGEDSVSLSCCPPGLRVTLAGLCYLFFANAFTYYGLVLLTTELHAATVGCDAETRSPLLSNSDYGSILATSLAEAPGLVAAALLIDSLGRRGSLAAGLAFASAFVFPLMFLAKGSTGAATTSILFGARCSIMCSFTVMVIYAPEVLPTSIRSTGLGLSNAVARLGGILAPFISVSMVEAGYEKTAELLYFVVPASGVALLMAVLKKETKGTDLGNVSTELELAEFS